VQTPDCAVIHTGEDGARGAAPVSRRWSCGTIVLEYKTGGTSGGRAPPARGRRGGRSGGRRAPAGEAAQSKDRDSSSGTNGG
jgi:hypothetical protein